MIITKTKMMGFLLTVILALSAPVVYADNGNGGNLSGGQSAVSDDQSSSWKGDHGWKHGQWGRHGHYMKSRFIRQLNLTDDQKKQLKDIWHKQRETMKATFEQIKANREGLHKELLGPTTDMNKINALQAQWKTLQAQMADNRLNSTLEVKKILTPEQFGKYLEFQKYKFSGRSHRGERNSGWGHRYCDFGGHCRHHHDYRGYQYGGGYGNYHKHGGDNGHYYDND